MQSSDQAENELRTILIDLLRPLVEARLKDVANQMEKVSNLQSNHERIFQDHSDQIGRLTETVNSLPVKLKTFEKQLLMDIDHQVEKVSNLQRNFELSLQNLSDQISRLTETSNSLKIEQQKIEKQFRSFRFFTIVCFMLTGLAIIYSIRH